MDKIGGKDLGSATAVHRSIFSELHGTPEAPALPAHQGPQTILKP